MIIAQSQYIVRIWLHFLARNWQILEFRGMCHFNTKERTFLWKGNFDFDHCIEPEFSVERIQNRWLNRLLCLIVNYRVRNFDVLWNCKNPATCNNDRNKNCYHLSQMSPGNLEYSHFYTTEICFIETQTNKITFLQIQSFSTIR